MQPEQIHKEALAAVIWEMYNEGAILAIKYGNEIRYCTLEQAKPYHLQALASTKEVYQDLLDYTGKESLTH